MADRKRQKEHIVTAMAMAPFRAVQRSYKHLSGGGFGLICSAMTTYCALLGVEAVLVATPAFVGDIAKTPEELRFVPKPYVADGARLGRLSPVAVRWDFMGSWINPWEDPKWPTKWNEGTVWENPGVLVLAIAVSLTIQQFESKVLRRQSFRSTKEKFERANAKKRVTPDKAAVAEAKLAAMQVNHHGTGGLLIKTLGVAGVIGLEVGAFIASFAGGSFLTTGVYGFLTIAGFEVFDYLGSEADENLKDGLLDA
jgi:hypothetical protein